MPSHIEVTPQERLIASRKSIIHYMNPDDRNMLSYREQNLDTIKRPNSTLLATWNVIKRTFLTWWYRHPASIAIELANPVLKVYASTYPFKLFGVSILLGAAVILTKPWRAISLGSLLLAAFKSSGFVSGFMSLLSRSKQKQASI